MRRWLKLLVAGVVLWSIIDLIVAPVIFSGNVAVLSALQTRRGFIFEAAIFTVGMVFSELCNRIRT